MTSATVLFVIAAFLSGAVIAVFAMLVAGIHAGDRPRHLTAASTVTWKPSPALASAIQR